MKNLIVAQSGGPTVAINASLAGVLDANCKNGYFDNVYGSINGLVGILEGKLLDLTKAVETDSDFINKLKATPAMYLGSCRYKLPVAEEDTSAYEKVYGYFTKYEIDTFLYIGGNDSMDTVMKLSDYGRKIGSKVKVIGIPKTIDNDLCGTDHTPGFGSAAKYIATSVLEVSHDAYIYPIKNVTIIEIMGRDAGWLTAASVLARNVYSTAPHLIYLPEKPFSIDSFVDDVKRELDTKDTVVVAISEGIRDKNGHYISASDCYTDIFGHTQLRGAGRVLEDIVRERIGVKTRSIEINVLQRCASHLASQTDIEESMMQGQKANELAIEGKTGVMVVLRRTGDEPYSVIVESCDVSEVANKVKAVPDEWINDAGNDVTDDMVKYLKPLIQGEPPVVYKGGLPQYLDVSHLY